MTGRTTRPVLAFSALALLAALAPGAGTADEPPPASAAGDPVQADGPAAGRAGPGAATATDAGTARPREHRAAPGEREDTSQQDGRTGARPATRHRDDGRPPGHGGGEPAARPRAADRVAAPARRPLALSVAVGPAARARALTTADTLAAHAARIQRRVAAYHRWGLQPPPPRPAPPVVKPRVRGATVVRRVPTDDRVVFLTIDDGARKSPEFLRMVDDLDIPVTSFLADDEAVLRPGYGYFRRLEVLGGTVQNHTLTHPYLPALSYREQRREICGQQDRIQEEMGGPQPRLFRPPYGAYDRDTLRAARACGLDAVVLWGMEAWADRIDFQEPGADLYPGAVILTHYRGPASWGDGGTMADMLRGVLEAAAEQGYAVGRLEDYL
ncbi:polysaccharide deacetylase family protein [Streptomyces sp. RKND-216]|uniref:polysaccharide deacetylase family protein n=1 Tax=Streptomyces sp. RKND-216 TaxID=2562581 RepID=UPI0014458B0C|nr:polysaccharide deacetylase family protein [Streptomyces sp. RKND-216]